VRSSITCAFIPRSPISSRKTTPPSPVSKQPFRSAIAPVKLPFLWPNSSETVRFPSWNCGQLTTRTAALARPEQMERLRQRLLPTRLP
jgi:hypothetical protein